jgi:anti-sigma factor RsiW
VTHLGEVAAALVDGELDHASRERAQRHLAHCGPCRAEVEAQRRLKAVLGGLAGTPRPAPDLTARLLALPVPGTDRVSTGPLRPAGPVSLRSAPGPSGSRRPRSRSRSRRRGLRRRTAVGSAVAALGVVALALGSPPGAATSVDPATDSFVVQHVDTTSGGPRVVRAGVTGR